MSTTYAETVDEIVADRLGASQEEIDDDTVFEADLDAESLDMVEVAEVIDRELGVYIPDEDLASLHTVGALKAYVGDHLE